MENTNMEIGSVVISEEVVGVIAGAAASEVKGIYSMSGGIAGGIAEILGKKNVSKGVKADIEDGKAAIDVHITVCYGAKIADISTELQQKVKKAVESMTGLEVLSVNVYIDGVYFEKEAKLKKEKAKEEEAPEA
ncbi:MAG: Asp23/Gls24 family envelope stress response protein [Clostridia bacterium]|nr:Asp23/Gls24 family envelope stress response protein [Clostridia bacterium]